MALKNHNTELNELLTTRQKGRGRTHALPFGAFATVFVALASILIFYGCKKETDFVKTENNLKHKNGITAVVFTELLNQIDFDFDSYGEVDAVEEEFTVVNGNCTYRILITSNRDRLNDWIAEANGMETGIFERQGLHVGISKICKGIVFPADFPANIINLCSFNFDNYVEGEDVDFEEEVTNEDGACYAIIITSNTVRLQEWIEAQEDKGKAVEVITITINGKPVLYIGISTNPKE